MRASRWALGLGTPLLVVFAACGGGKLGGEKGGAGGGVIQTGSGGGVIQTGSGGGGDIGGGTGGAAGNVAGWPLTLVTGPENSAWDIAVDATHVYWTDRAARAVMRIPKEGGTPETLAWPQEDLGRLAVDSNFVYWTNTLPSGDVMKLAIGGGTPVPVATGQLRPVGIAVDATNVYWTNAGGSTLGVGSVMKASLATGATVTLAANQEAALAITVDATSVYWSKGPFETGGGEVMRVPIGGGTPVSLALLPPDDPAMPSMIGASLAVDGQNVYFPQTTGPIESGLPRWRLKAVPRAGGTQTWLSESRWIDAVVAMDGRFPTWASDRAIVSKFQSSTAFAETPGQAQRIAYDQTHLYFTTREGAVMKMAKLRSSIF